MALRLLPALLTACAAAPEPPRPVALSLHPTVGSASGRIELGGVVRRVAGAYVRVLVLGDSVEDGIPTSGVVNGGSGVIVGDEGYVVTAAHIAKSTTYRAQVTTMDGLRREARILDVAPDRELALMRLAPFRGMRAAPPLAGPGPRRGEAVFSIGTPGNRMAVVTAGTVTQPRLTGRIGYGEYGYVGAVALDMEVAPGYSGGPVFDRQGRLVGIIASFGLGDTRQVPYRSTRVAYAVPAAAIAAYLAATRARR